MNRVSSVLAGAAMTALSGAVVGAATMAQGVFGGGSQADTPAVVDNAALNGAAPAEAVALEQSSPTQRYVYVDREPLVVTKDVYVKQSAAPQEATAVAAEAAAPDPTAGAPAPKPQAAAAPAQQPASPVRQQPVVQPVQPVATAGMGTRGGDQPRRIGRSTAT